MASKSNLEVRGGEAPGRPFGVYIIILLLLANLLVNLLTLWDVISGVEPLELLILDNQLLTSLYTGGLVVFLAVIIYGLWTLQRWAWIITIFLVGYSLAIGVWQYFHHQEPYLTLLVSAITVFYLNLRDVQIAFGGRKRTVKPS